MLSWVSLCTDVSVGIVLCLIWEDGWRASTNVSVGIMYSIMCECDGGVGWQCGKKTFLPSKISFLHCQRTPPSPSHIDWSPPHPPPFAVQFNLTTYYKSTAICKVHKGPLRFIKILSDNVSSPIPYLPLLPFLQWGERYGRGQIIN